MDKNQYFEMCEMLGSEPLESEVPLDFEDLPLLVQISISIHNTLRDSWDYMNGNYIGKDLTNIFDIFELYKLNSEEKLLAYRIISIIDNEKRLIVQSKDK